jgi:hypothetical protein
VLVTAVCDSNPYSVMMIDEISMLHLAKHNRDINTRSTTIVVEKCLPQYGMKLQRYGQHIKKNDMFFH